LPREIRARGCLDHGAQAVVGDARDFFAELRGERFRRGDFAERTTLRRPLRLIERAHAEAERIDGEATRSETRDQLRREEL